MKSMKIQNFVKNYKFIGIFVCIVSCLTGMFTWYFFGKNGNQDSKVVIAPMNSITNENQRENVDVLYIEGILQNQWGYEKYDELSQARGVKEKIVKILEDCGGKDFVEYRQCLISELQKMEKTFVKTDSDRKYWKNFYSGLQFEIDNFPIYNFVDQLPSFLGKKIVIADDGKTYDENGNILTDGDMQELWPYNPNVCFAIGEKKFINKDGKGYLSSDLPNFYVSFGDGTQEKLAKVFPNFQDKIIKTWNEGEYYGKPRSNPCWFRTFGPEIGHILHADTSEQGQFLFIALYQGGGSGEFSFGIFFRENPHKKWRFMGDFGMYSVHPFNFNYDRGGTLENMKLTEYGQNNLLMPYMYIDIERFMIDINHILEILDSL